MSPPHKLHYQTVWSHCNALQHLWRLWLVLTGRIWLTPQQNYLSWGSFSRAKIWCKRIVSPWTTVLISLVRLIRISRFGRLLGGHRRIVWRRELVGWAFFMRCFRGSQQFKSWQPSLWGSSCAVFQPFGSKTSLLNFSSISLTDSLPSQYMASCYAGW